MQFVLLLLESLESDTYILNDRMNNSLFCHFLYSSLYLGEIAINSCITEYLTYVQKVINFYKSNDEVSALPCIVNTMGYSKGISY